jgi:biotin carboxyl carrier protein
VRSVTAPLTGTVVKMAVQEGEVVAERQPLMVLEAMKMEHVIVAPGAATVLRLHAAPGDLVQAGTALVELDHRPAAPEYDDPAGRTNRPGQEERP